MSSSIMTCELHNIAKLPIVMYSVIHLLITIFQEFEHEVLVKLWQYVCDCDPLITCGAYKALAAFPQSHFHLNHLPHQVR